MHKIYLCLPVSSAKCRGIQILTTTYLFNSFGFLGTPCVQSVSKNAMKIQEAVVHHKLN